MNCLDTIVKVLEDKKNYTNSKIYKYELELLDTIIRWDVENLVGPLGLFHIYLNHPQSSELFKVLEKGSELVNVFLQYLNHSQVPDNVILLCLRCLANMFWFPSGETVLWERGTNVLHAVNQYANHEKNVIRNAVATIYLNFSIAYAPTTEEIN